MTEHQIRRETMKTEYYSTPEETSFEDDYDLVIEYIKEYSCLSHRACECVISNIKDCNLIFADKESVIKAAKLIRESRTK